MCIASTAKRRRRQAANGYKHLSPLRRPIYHKPDIAKQSRRLRDRIEREKRMAANRGKKK